MPVYSETWGLGFYRQACALLESMHKVKTFTFSAITSGFWPVDLIADKNCICKISAAQRAYVQQYLLQYAILKIYFVNPAKSKKYLSGLLCIL